MGKIELQPEPGESLDGRLPRVFAGTGCFRLPMQDIARLLQGDEGRHRHAVIAGARGHNGHFQLL